MDNQELLQAIQGIIKSEIEANNTKILTPIKGELKSINERMTKIEVTLENDISKKLNLLFEGQQGMNEKFRQLDTLTDKVDDIQTTVEVLKIFSVKK